MISVVATLFRSEFYIREFYQRCLKQLRKLGQEYEFVFVDDGSPDNSLGVVLELIKEDSAVRAVELSRNFGHHKAMMTGLQHARGEFVFLIDVDLEEPPECLELFWQQLASSDADVSFGVQSKRQGPLSGRILGELYYTIYNWISVSPMPRNQLTARLMRRNYVEALLGYREHRFAIEAIWHLAGYRQVPVAINKSSHKGSSSYTLSHKLRLFLDSITSTCLHEPTCQRSVAAPIVQERWSCLLLDAMRIIHDADKLPKAYLLPSFRVPVDAASGGTMLFELALEIVL